MLEYLIKPMMLTYSLYNMSGYKCVYEYLLEVVMANIFTTSQRQYLAQIARPFMLQEGVQYRYKEDNKFHQNLQPE